MFGVPFHLFGPRPISGLLCRIFHNPLTTLNECSRINGDLRTCGMTEKKLSIRCLVLMLAGSFALLTSCTEHTSTGTPGSHSPMPVGSNENPQTAEKKATGGS